MPKKLTADEVIKGWDTHARELLAGFDPVDGDPHRIVLLNPVLFNLFPPVTGKDVLDAGCGEGYLSRKLVRFGATVTAVDLSRVMIEIAKERTSPDLAIQYIRGNCEKMDFLQPKSFDLVISNMVIQDLPDHRAFLHSINTLLRDDGILVMSFSHPCFITPDHGWERDKDGGKLHWNTDQYFSEGPNIQPLPTNNYPPTFLFHRTLSEYLKSIALCGFELLDFVEPHPSEEMMVKYPKFRDDLRMCDFIVIKARKKTHQDVRN